MKKQLEVILSNLEDSVEDLQFAINEMSEPKDNDEPVVGDLCQFWNNVKDEPLIGKLSKIDTNTKYPYNSGGSWFKYARKISVSKLRELIEEELSNQQSPNT